MLLGVRLGTLFDHSRRVEHDPPESFLTPTHRRTALRLIPLALTLTLFTTSCAFHSTATQWNDRVGPDGEPVFVKSSTSVGFNLLILLKIIGRTDMPGMIDEVTGEIAEENGNHVRMIESANENYWYGFPPFTWIVTPVLTTVTAEYRPSAEELAKARAENVDE